MFKCSRFHLLLNYCVHSLALISISPSRTGIGSEKQIGVLSSDVFKMITCFGGFVFVFFSF